MKKESNPPPPERGKRPPPPPAPPSKRVSGHERVVSRLLELEKHIRKEADFNRAWTDGRLGSDRPASPEYLAERRRLADERDRWADAAAEAAAMIGG